VHRENALATIEESPPGLQPFYDRILHQLKEGKPTLVEGCMRLLKVMLMVYRPLKLEEICSVTGLPNNNITIKALVDRCASFIRKRGADIEFVHQSARDYLGGKDGHSILDAHTAYGHGNITLNCLSYLTKELKSNLLGLQQPSSDRDLVKKLKDKGRNAKLASLDYAATFWMQHLKDGRGSQTTREPLAEKVYVFFQTKVLEWLECLSNLDELPRAVKWLQVLRGMLKVSSVQP
jgi:hypothetical protein